MARALESKGDEAVVAEVRKGVKELCDRFPIY
jgi:glycine/serine hydroxymethyltransferase